MQKVAIGLVLGIALTIAVIYSKPFVVSYLASHKTVSPLGKILEKPLTKYTVLNLASRSYTGSQIVFDEAIATTSAFTKYQFHFESDGKKVTGIATVPLGNNLPVIVQFRGYVDREKYVSGEGTAHSAEVYAQNGFLSLAPDFLGYGGSDMPSTDVFEERFQTYTTALNLLASVQTLSMVDPTRIGIWGHSNGGQIALTALEVLAKPIPTVLWAPVSKPFPYSILYYTDEASDHGMFLRRELAKFEEEYNAELYSLTNYVDRLVGPIQLHQGTQDDAVPLAWSDEFAKHLHDVEYFTYPGADHNMTGSWNTVVNRDIVFFNTYLR